MISKSIIIIVNFPKTRCIYAKPILILYHASTLSLNTRECSKNARKKSAKNLECTYAARQHDIALQINEGRVSVDEKHCIQYQIKKVLKLNVISFNDRKHIIYQDHLGVFNIPA